MSLIPMAYTRDELAQFMHTTLSQVGADLGFDPASDYDEAIIDTLLAYGETDLAEAADIARLRAHARVAALQLALMAAAAHYDVSDGTQSLKRSQVMGNVTKALEKAEVELQSVIAAGGGATDPSAAVVSRIRYVHDPYAFTEAGQAR